MKGTLFVDYVRMIRSRKDIDWSAHLLPADMEFLDDHVRILPSAWYPFDTFERFGLAVLKEIAGNQMEFARMWGRRSADLLLEIYLPMVAIGDPAESARKFEMVRSSFFDFPGISVEIDSPESLRMSIRFTTESVAGKAQSYQALGSMERLLEVAGATDISHVFERCVWNDDPETLIVMGWKNPSS